MESTEGGGRAVCVPVCVSEPQSAYFPISVPDVRHLVLTLEMKMTRTVELHQPRKIMSRLKSLGKPFTMQKRVDKAYKAFFKFCEDAFLVSSFRNNVIVGCLG